MNEVMTATQLGYVVLGIAALVSLGVGLKHLFKTPAVPSAGNGSHDVSRREFEDLKDHERRTTHDIRDHLHRLDVQVALLRHRNRSPQAPPETNV